jgi:hypothetical protein
MRQRQDIRTDRNVKHVDVYRHDVYKIHSGMIAAAAVAAAAVVVYHRLSQLLILRNVGEYRQRANPQYNNAVHVRW